MLTYIKAENLKYKNTFAKKLIVIAPICMVVLAYFTGMYFTVNGYNWWYSIFLPGFVTLLTALVCQNEEKKLHYRAVFALPVSLKKIWTAKILLIGIYVVAASVIHMAGILLGVLTVRSGMSVPIFNIIAATFLLIVTSLWQIPLCLFLAKKFGLMVTILLNLGGGTILEIFAASKPYWWVCPYSWAARLMCPVLKILPQGVMANANDPLLNPAVIPIGIVLSLVLFTLLTVVTAHWFPNQEVK